MLGDYKKVKDIELMRTRWKRWLGQKTRYDKPYWVTLLDSNWKNWANKVYRNSNVFDKTLGNIAGIPEIKFYYLNAINIATMEQLEQLDMLYCSEKVGY